MDTARQIYIEFTQPIYEFDITDMSAFTIVGKEIDPMYAGALSKDTTYKVASCVLLEDSKTVLLTMADSFRNVIGDVTVAYDATHGYIAGNGGIVESFTRTFTPTNLKPLYNPGAVENIKLQSKYDALLIRVGIIDVPVVENIKLNSAYSCNVTAIITKPHGITENIKLQSIFEATPTLVGSLLP